MKCKAVHLFELTCWVVVLAGVATGCSMFSGKPSANSAEADRTIESQIRTRLKEEPIVRSALVNVTSTHAIVELTGFIDSAAAKSRAGLIAASVPGVAQVRNDLLVPAATGK